MESEQINNFAEKYSKYKYAIESVLDKFNQMKNQIEYELGREPTLQEIASETEIPLEIVEGLSKGCAKWGEGLKPIMSPKSLDDVNTIEELDDFIGDDDLCEEEYQGLVSYIQNKNSANKISS